MKEIQLKDGLNTLKDNIESKRPICLYNTDIECRNELGELLFKKHNTILLGGRRFTLEKLFNVKGPSLSNVTLNEMLDTLYGTTSNITESNDGTGPKKEKCVCLFGVGCGGAGIEFGTVKSPSASEVNLYNLIPLRYVPVSRVSEINREQYFMSRTKDGYTAFYLKRFDSTPKIKLMVNGTEITELSINSNIGSISFPNSGRSVDINDNIEAYIEITLKVSTEDVREWFDEMGETDATRINELGLYLGCYNESTNDYDEVECFSKLTFNNEPLDTESKELNIIYRIYI